MNRSFIIILLFAIAISAPCQSKKERKKYKIKSTTEWETATVDGKSETYKCAYEEFDKNGRSILKAEYAPDGSTTFKTTISYDSHGNKTAETLLDIGKKKNVMWTYRYNALNDKTEESEFNATGALQKKTVFAYDANGNKISESETDASGSLIKKVVFTYNSKNLKITRSMLPGSKQKEKSKKWDYVYY